MEPKEFKEKILQICLDEFYDQSDVENLITEFCRNKPIPMLVIEGKFLVRCRYNFNGEVFNNVSQLSYNPNIEKIVHQRCNYKNQQVFYASIASDTKYATANSTAIMEVCDEYVKKEDLRQFYITMSRWKINRPLKVLILSHSNESQIKNLDFKREKVEFDKIVRENNFQEINNLHDSLEFMSNVFCKYEQKKYYYRISAAYYNFLMRVSEYQNAEIDGLIYPSANTEAAGMNIVLRKEMVDKNFISCDYAVMLKAHRTPNKVTSLMITQASNEVFVDESGIINFTSIW